MDVFALTEQLVGIDSVNPDLVAGGAGEATVARAITAWAGEHGLEVEVLEATPGRPSVLCRARGSGAGRTLMLCGHTDTVSAEGVAAPRRHGDRYHGRGAYDMKGALAAALVACARVKELGLAGDVVVAAVADEEYASIGVQEVLAHVTADAAIVVEPTEERVAIAHKGFVWAEIEIAGRAAHGSRPHLGVDAIAAAGPVLTGIGDWDARLAERVHPLVGRASVHASVISGGVEMSSYPASCRIGLERRTLPGETLADVEAELARLTGASWRTTLVRKPFELDPGHELVRLFGQEPVGVSFWADSAFTADAGIPTVLYGPIGEGAHAAEEWVSIASCERVADRLVALAEDFCA